jgi:hypothetical protein
VLGGMDPRVVQQLRVLWRTPILLRFRHLLLRVLDVAHEGRVSHLERRYLSLREFAVLLVLIGWAVEFDIGFRAGRFKVR